MNKKHTLRFRAANKDIFLAIKTGKKKVETRAATEKYRNIKSGDMLVLMCGKNRFKKQIRHTTIFKTIPAMLKKYKIKEINPAAKTKADLTKIYHSFPGYREKIKKYGLIALELR